MRSPVCLAATLVAAAAACLLLHRFSGSVPASVPAPAAESGAVAPFPVTASVVERRALAEPHDSPVSRGFDALVAELIELTLRGTIEFERGANDAAAATDAEVRSTVGEVLSTVVDYEDRALFALSEVGDTDEPRSKAARTVHGRLLHLGLQKLSTRARSGDTQALDGFLGALLEIMVPHRATAEVVAWLLADTPYLGAGQEEAVLRLAQTVPTYPWLADHVRRLLLTLWRNLEASGSRARDQIETLALMLKDDTNDALRAAALERLVTSTEPELVEFVLRDVEERRDGERARDLAQAAATKLPAEEALRVARRLRSLVPSEMILPALELARRDDGAVRSAYESLAAAGADGPWRADLVSGLGFQPSTANLTLVAHAFRNDPDVEVRTRALMALTANAAASFGTRALAAAVDDPTLCGGGPRLGILVGALGNLARAGEREATERLGRRLAARGDLPPTVRAELEGLLRDGPPRPPR
ncbi:MAG: hypothetical protein R3F56_21540 [Planctomycetota bacterium]